MANSGGEGYFSRSQHSAIICSCLVNNRVSGKVCVNIPSSLSGKSLVHDIKAFQPDILCSAREKKNINQNIKNQKMSYENKQNIVLLCNSQTVISMKVTY